MSALAAVQQRAATVDITQTEAFLTAVAPGGNYTFQTFGEGDAKRPGLAQVLHGTLAEHATELQRLNSVGAGVFVMVNEGDGKGRTAKNVTAVRALWLDIDSGGKEALTRVLERCRFGKVAPDAVVESSPGKYHCYWRVPDCLLERFSEYQKALAAAFGGDPAVVDLPRVMRLPGFQHRKGEPVMTKLLLPKEAPPLSPRRAIAAADLLRALGVTVGASGSDLAPGAAANGQNAAQTRPGKALVAGDDWDKPNLPPGDAEAIVEGCAQMRQFRDAGGKVPEPLWWAGLSVLTRCEGGDKLIHEWSKGDQRYSEAQTQDKAARTAGPATCETFRNLNAEGCKGCPHAGQVKSPIMIGVSRPPAEVRKTYSEMGLALDHNSRPKAHEANIEAMIRGSRLGGQFWFDAFMRRPLTTLDGAWRPVTDADAFRAAAILQTEYGLLMASLPKVKPALDAVTYSDERNLATAWIESLKWDRTPRVDAFFERYAGAAGDDYSRAVSKVFWLSLAARMLRPGCKADAMVVLEGAQGVGKSSLLAAVGGDWFGDNLPPLDNKDALSYLGGKVLVEIAEMHTFNRAAVERIKGMLAAREDCYRPAYGRNEVTHLRQCIFAGTTNQSEYLRDPTGARRFLPLAVGRCSPAEVTAAREQLFAEAAARVKAGEDWWPEAVPGIAARLADERETRRERDPWEEPIGSYIAKTQPARILVPNVLSTVLNTPVERQGKQEQMRVSNCLRALKWKSTRAYQDGKQVRVWVPAER